MIVKRSIITAIVGFWCVMNFLLVKRQLAAPQSVITLRSTEKLTETLEEWWGVFYRGEKIGFASQVITPKAGGYKLHDRSTMNLNMLGTVQPTMTELEMEANDDWILEKFSFELRSKEIRFSARGQMNGTKLQLSLDSGGHQSSRELSLRQAPYLLAALKPYVVTQQLETGKKFLFPTFDPSTLSEQITTVVIEGNSFALRIAPSRRFGCARAFAASQCFRGWTDKGERLKKSRPPDFPSYAKR
jgi:hypothetical protein